MVGNPWQAFDEQLTAIPGATSLHPAVLRSMQRPYVNPWSSEFLAFFDETLERLKQVYGTRGDVLVMMGPIRLAMDAVVCSLLAPGEKAAVCVNGHWGSLFVDMIRAHGGVPVAIEQAWGLPVDPSRVREQLDTMGPDPIKALFVTHVETSTGVTNPIVELGQIAQERGLLYVVDAAQTLGGMDVRTDEWGIDFCLGGNHKCMSAPAGLSYMAVSSRGWEALEQREIPIQGWYSSLLVWREVWMRRQSGYFTFPATLVYGLRAALDLMLGEPLAELYRCYMRVARAIRCAAIEMGLEPVPPCRQCPGCEAPGRFCADTVTALRYPKQVQHEAFTQIMHEQYGISLAGTYGPLAGAAFRVGPTGLMQVQKAFTQRLLSSMGMAFRRLGLPVRVEHALATAEAILAGPQQGPI